MEIAALVTWLLTAGGGFYLLYTWISHGGPRNRSTSRFPPALIFGHFGLAATGLVLWIIYVIVDSDALAWIALILLLPVAILGFTMLARWLPTYRSRMTAVADGPAERHFPVVTVGAHGLLAVVTVVLVLLAVLEG
jgi:manganese efflux pump family protein